jgi:hypothetical protein
MSGETSSTQVINQHTFDEFKWAPVINGKAYPSVFIMAYPGYPLIPSTHLSKMLFETVNSDTARNYFQSVRDFCPDLKSCGRLDEHYEVST